MKKTISLLLILSVLFTLSSCSGAKQLNERLIIQGLGIDLDNDNYKLTIMYLDTDSKEQSNTKIISTSGKSVVDALANSISASGKEPLYSQMEFILMGTDVAKNGFEEPLNFFAQYYEVRQNIDIFVAENKASDILNIEGLRPNQIGNLSGDMQRSGRTVTSSLMQMENDLISDSICPKTTIISSGETGATTNGTAIFKNDKYSYSLNKEQSLGLLLITSNVQTAREFTVEEDKKDFTLTQCESKITMEKVNDFVVFDIKITAKADVYEILEDKEKTKTEMEKRVKNICNEFIEKSVYEKKSDVAGFSSIILNNDLEFYNQIESMSTLLQNSKYNVTVEIDVF